MNKLPTKLGKEPLIDAVFELRFESRTSAPSVLPGFLYSKLEGEKRIENLPAMELPKPLRDADPSLQFAGLVRVHWSKFSVAVGDRSLSVACGLPYPGWSEFKPAIEKVLSLVREIAIVEAVDRFSMKYVNLVPCAEPLGQINLVDVSLEVGGHRLADHAFSVRLQVPEDEMLHVVTVVASATAQLPSGEKRNGLVVDIDSIVTTPTSAFDEWVNNLGPKLDKLHAANKRMFFKCLRPETVQSLEPTYD